MTRLDVPSNLLVERGPPEAVCESALSRIESVMSELVVSFSKDMNVF